MWWKHYILEKKNITISDLAILNKKGSFKLPLLAILTAILNSSSSAPRTSTAVEISSDAYWWCWDLIGRAHHSEDMTQVLIN